MKEILRGVGIQGKDTSWNMDISHDTTDTHVKLYTTGHWGTILCEPPFDPSFSFS
jgi:hypothetical protein